MSVATASADLVMVEGTEGRKITRDDAAFAYNRIVMVVEDESDLGPRVPGAPSGCCPRDLPRVEVEPGTTVDLVAGDPYILKRVQILAIDTQSRLAESLLPSRVRELLAKCLCGDPACPVGSTVIVVRFPSGRSGWIDWRNATELQHALPHLALAA